MVYDAANRLISRELPNGIKTTYAYNDRDQILSIEHRKSDNTLLSAVVYERRGLGEPTKITREDGSYVLLDYDDALRLTKEAYYDSVDNLIEEILYSYDAAGNRLTYSDNTGSLNYSYEPGYKLVGALGSGGAESYAYDLDGRVSTMARDGITRSLDYDATDRLLQVIDESTGSGVDYTYNGLGIRIGANEAGTQRAFVVGPVLGNGLESNHLVADDAGTMLAGYVFAGDQPIMRFGPEGPVYYLTDALGSIISLVNDSEDLVATYEYDGFGNIRDASGTAQNPPAGVKGDFRFHGEWLETTTGLYYLRSRDYDPRVGRFLSRDPIEPDLYEAESLHPYLFANGNPHLFSDPTGLFALSVGEFSISISISNSLRSMRTYAAHEFKSYVREQVEEAAANALIRLVQAMVPFEATRIKAPDGTTVAGKEFERKATYAICKVFGDGGHTRSIWFEVPVSKTDGEPQGNGKNCTPSGRSPRPTTRRSPTFSHPDFIMSRAKPLNLSSFFGGRKSYLIGDFKFSTKSINPGDNQSFSIVRHAKNYGYHLVLYLTVKSSDIKRKKINAFAYRQKVKIFMISLVN
jgi:RHS repeat-associated protein